MERNNSDNKKDINSNNKNNNENKERGDEKLNINDLNGDKENKKISKSTKRTASKNISKRVAKTASKTAKTTTKTSTKTSKVASKKAMKTVNSSKKPDNKSTDKTLRLEVNKPKGLGRKESEYIPPSTIRDRQKHNISTLQEESFVVDANGRKVEVIKKNILASQNDLSAKEKNRDMRPRLIELVKNLYTEHLNYEKVDALDTNSNTVNKEAMACSLSLKLAEQTVQRHLIKMQEQVDNLDDDILSLYKSNSLNIHEKSLLRQVVTHVFGHHYYKSTAEKINKRKKNIFQPHVLESDDHIVITQAFALPVFGSANSIHQFLDDKTAILKLCNLIMDSGYISNSSDVVALLNIPLSSEAIYRPSVLNTISAAWADLVVNKEDIDKTIVREIEKDIVSYLRPFEVREGVKGFIIPGVRVFSGKACDYKALDEVLNKWEKIDSIQKNILQSWWQTVSGHIVLEAQVTPGTLMFRPPAPLLVAQAQSLAWHITHQVYDRLGAAPFTEIDFISISSNKLALRAYNNRKKIIAQSDPVSLFDVVSASDDFANVLTEECGSNGPRSKLREIIRTLDDEKTK